MCMFNLKDLRKTKYKMVSVETNMVNTKWDKINNLKIRQLNFKLNSNNAEILMLNIIDID